MQYVVSWKLSQPNWRSWHRVRSLGQLLELEAEWNERWRARSAMLWRALYWIFKHKSAEWRLYVFNGVRDGWYALAHN